MSEKKKETPRSGDAAIEREIRAGRKFSMTEAIGRIGGGGLLKGASPVSKKKQSELEVEWYLEKKLGDSEGALAAVLLNRMRMGDVLHDNDYDQPFAALARFVERILNSEERLHSLVDEVDAQWGRIYSERPHFQKDGSQPDEDDPYTYATVRATLSQLLKTLHDDSTEV